jgi:hypothetical protein
LLFVGWRRLILVTLAGIAPVVVYGIYVQMPAVSGRHYNVAFSAGRVTSEYTAVIVLVASLLAALSDRAVRARAREIGVTEFAPRIISRSRIVAGVILGLVVIGNSVMWGVLSPGKLDDMWYWDWILIPIDMLLIPVLATYALSWKTSRLFYFLAAVGFVGVVAWMVTGGPTDPNWITVLVVIGFAVIVGFGSLGIWRWIKRGEGSRIGRFSYGLSTAPAWVATALLLACVAGPLVNAQERRSVARIEQPGGVYDILHEVEQSRGRIMQDHLCQLLGRTATAEMVSP